MEEAADERISDLAAPPPPRQPQLNSTLHLGIASGASRRTPGAAQVPLESSWLNNGRPDPQSDEEGRLSLLPDDVLLSIMLRLDLRTAVRTSVLSTRWRPLPWLLPELNIDVKDFVSVPHSEPIAADLMHAAMLTLTEATKSLVAKPQRESIVTSLRVKLDFVDTFSCNIGPLLCDAADSGLLKDLDLAILDETRSSCVDLDILLKRGQEVDGFFRAYPSILHCLTKLSLHDLTFSQLDMNHILFDHCKQLKHLTLSACDAGYCSVWKIDAPNSKLRILELRNCWFEKIELISLPKLEKLDCDIWVFECAPLFFGFVPSLQKLCLSNYLDADQNILKLSELLHGAAGIHALTLDFQGENIWIQPETVQLTSAFSNLRKLSVHGIFVEFDLLWTTTFLEAAPSIEILHVGVGEHTCLEVHRKYQVYPQRTNPRWELDFRGSKKMLLKELQIAGFRPLEQQLKFIRVILERATNLQAVFLKEVHINCKECNAITSNAPPFASTQPAYPKNKEEQDMVLRRVTDGTFSGQIVFGD